MENNLLKNKTAVVFGAGGNLGKQVTRAFAGQGATVFASDIDEKSLLTLTGVTSNVVDALDEMAVEAYLEKVSAQAGQLDILINLSGSDPAVYNHGRPATEVSLEQLLVPMKTATGTQFITAKAAHRFMAAQQNGVIIFITSTLSKIAPAWTTALTASHAATEAMAMSLATEWGPEGIRVIGVRSEAMTESPTIDYTFTTMGKNIGLSREEMQGWVEEKVPLRRLTKADETAKAIVLAASDLAGFMTGTFLNHSGGHILN